MKYLLSILLILGLTNCKKEKSTEYNLEAIELNNQASILYQKNKLDSALVLFNQSIKLDKDYYLPHSNKIGIYLKRKQFNEALYESEMVIKKNPKLAENWFLAGLINEYQGDTNKAKDYYKKSIEIFTERIDNSDNDAKKNANKLNRAISKIFIDDESYLEDFKELRKNKELSIIIDQLQNKNKNELINNLMH